MNDFKGLWAGVLTVDASAEVIEMAETLCRKHRLRAYDAVHLASEMVLSQASSLSVVLASFDLELRDATLKEGIEIWPQQIPDSLFA